MRLKGKTILVTAAGQGIGRATVLAMVNEGAVVWATDINAALFTSYEGMANIHTRTLDVTDKVNIEKVVSEIPEIDALFNCAGIVHAGTIAEADDAQWDVGFNLNVRAQFWMIQATLSKLQASAKKHGGASIINMASVCSSIKGLPNRLIYGATKAAVIGLTKSVAADYVAQGIRCNAVCPGTVDTPSLHDRIHAQPDPVLARQQFIARQPMGRLAQADEIAPLVVFLASDESAFMTGQAHTIDGGIAI